MNFKIKLQKRFHWDFQQNIYLINNLIFGNWLLKKYFVFPSSNLVISPKKQNSIPSNNMEYFSINSVPSYVPQWACKLLMFISRVFIVFVAFLDVVFVCLFFFSVWSFPDWLFLLNRKLWIFVSLSILWPLLFYWA